MANLGKKTYGKRNDFFQKPVVTHTATGFPDTPQVFVNLYGQFSFSLVNEGNDVVEYSFDGNNVSGDMTPNSPTEAMFFDNRPVSRIFFRLPNGGGPATVRVEAWVCAGR